MESFAVSTTETFKLFSTFQNNNEVFLTAAVAEKNADPIVVCKDMYQEIGSVLKQHRLHIVQERIFGSISIQPEVLKERRHALSMNGIRDDVAPAYIEGNPLWGEGLAGVQIQAFAPRGDDEIWTIDDNHVPCGRGWKRNGTTFLLLQHIDGFEREGNKENSNQEQAARMFDRANRLLQHQGVSYRNVVRTWIYISDIVQWYCGFNQARNAKYKEFKVIPAQINGIATEKIYLPASTGIEGKNPVNAAAVVDVLAVKKESESGIHLIQNTGGKQKSPYRYGSAFSRSVIIREPGCDTHYISGTASIDEEGKTIFTGDVEGQIRHTFNVVEALLQQEGASLKNICQATVFLKNKDDAAVYERVMKERGLSVLPAVCVVADICRDDLLFEVDAVATVKK